MIRCAIYIRVSTEEQHLHGLSLDAQRDALIEYAKKNDMQIVDVYADEGITARKQLNRRLEFQRLMRDVQDNKIDVILVTKLDRWFRNIKDYYNTQDVLEKHNCNWRTIYENYDTSTAGGRLHINIMLSVNQDECDRTSERIKAVFKHKVEKGEVISGYSPYGYKIENKRYVIVEEEAEVVRDIFNYFEKCGSVAQTVKFANARYGISYYKRIHRILSNIKYSGEYKGVKGFCPAIIEQEQFDTVQRMLQHNRKYYVNNRKEPLVYIFGTLVRCKKCGRVMVGGSSKMYNKKVGEYDHKTYRCNGHYQNKACTNKYAISEKGILEKYILKHIKPELEKYKVSYEVKQRQNKKNKNDAVKKKIQGKLDKLKDLYLDDLIDKDAYKKEYETLNKQMQELNELPQEKDIDLSAIQAFLDADFETIYNTLSCEEKRRIWLSVIDYIEVGENRNDITIHFI